jgi:hypothetical protein
MGIEVGNLGQLPITMRANKFRQEHARFVESPKRKMFIIGTTIIKTTQWKTFREFAGVAI